MRMRDQVLKDAQRKIFLEILKIIDEDKIIKKNIRHEFREFLKMENVKFSDVVLTRLFKNPFSTKYENWIYLFDFINDVFMPDIVSRTKYSGQFDSLVSKYDDLKSSLDDLLVSNNNPLVSIYLKMGAHGQRIPKKFVNEFIGYRRSSNMGEVVRFYLKTSKTSDPDKILYANEYYRNHNHWKVDGVGLYSDRTLYLFGYAKHYSTEESLGYRLMALRPLGIGNVVVGPLISMDESGPIAARVVLVPLEDHCLTDGQSKLAPEDLKKHLISPGASEDVTRYVNEIKNNLSSVFEGYPDNHLFKLISNLSLSTLKGVPRENDPLVSRELQYRRIAHQNEWSLSIVEALMDRALKNMPPLGPSH